MFKANRGLGIGLIEGIPVPETTGTLQEIGLRLKVIAATPVPYLFFLLSASSRFSLFTLRI